MTESLSYADATLRQLRAEITRHGYTQKTFAPLVGLTQSRVSDYLNGRNEMGVNRLGEWLAALGVSNSEFGDGVDDLMGIKR